MRKTLLLVLAGLLLAAAGCRGDISKVAAGMSCIKVEGLMGDPKRIIRGEGLDTDMQTYVYPQGRVHFKKFRVVLVEPAGEKRPITEGVQEREEREKER